VGVVCVDPSRRLEAHHRRAAGVVAMSATLTPLAYFSEVLGLSRLDPLLTSAPSPFPADRRLVRVVPTVSTTFREREASAPEVARLIERVVAVRPGCYAAFFPSFAYLSLVAPKLRLPPSQVLVQLPSMATPLRQRTLDRLRAAAGPVLLLAVMGGVFGEGIDLPGEALIGAIVVGPGMPAVSFERALMQRHFDERYEAGFAYAMIYPGLQRVIQAAGRVIRSEEDRGVIVLLGRRFAEGELGRCLPPHWYRHDPAELCCDDPVPALEAFWNGHSEALETSASWSPGPPGPMFVDDA
jgi:DNA excision repair protein ERCC-2